MSLTAKEKTHLLISDAAYQKHDALDKLKDMGWKRIGKLSSKETSCFVKGRRVVVGFRGTVINLPKDWATDAKAIATGGEKADQDQRFMQAGKDFGEIKAAYPGKILQVTGHSLGGTLALFVGRMACIGGTAFNPGSSPVGGLEKLMKRAGKQGAKRHDKGKSGRACTKVKIIRIADEKVSLKNDPISANARKNNPGSRVKDLHPKSRSLNPLNFHYTDNFYKYT